MKSTEFKESWLDINEKFCASEPFPQYVEQIGNQIKNFMIPENRKYQGATGNAQGLLDGLSKYIEECNLPDNEIDKFKKNINCVIDFLLSVRQTSQVPLNTAYFILKRLDIDKCTSVEEAKKALGKEIEFHRNNYKLSVDQIASHFKTRIIDRVETYGIEKLIIGSHCHSSIVVRALIEAKDYIQQVVVDKTEPEQQGVLTAYELLEAGIPVKLINLSQFGHEFRRIGMFMFGIDAVSADGVVLNKTGTRMIATLAKTKDLPVYFLGSTYKYARKTLLGGLVKLEHRKVEEKILHNHLGIDLTSYYGRDSKFKDKEGNPLLTVQYTAFDTTKPEFYDSIVSEVGFLPMREAFLLAWKDYL